MDVHRGWKDEVTAERVNKSVGGWEASGRVSSSSYKASRSYSALLPAHTLKHEHMPTPTDRLLQETCKVPRSEYLLNNFYGISQSSGSKWPLHNTLAV